MINPNVKNLTFRSQYWSDPQAKAAFKRFILETHGLNFSKWDEQGFWDEAYTPFSFFIGEEVVASVCIYLLDAIVQGKPEKLIQISGVGTHQDWRRQGLSRKLTELGLDWAGKSPAGLFLFADGDAIPYYEKTGFHAGNEYLHTGQITPTESKKGLVKLDLSNPRTLQKVYSYAQRREPISDNLSILNPKLLMFHALYTLSDLAYEIPKLDCIIFFKRQNQQLHIYDILAPTLPDFDSILPFIALPDDRAVIFHFSADKMGLTHLEIQLLQGENFYTREHFPIDPVIFPYTSRA